MTAPPSLPKFRRQLILSVLMVCSLLIWLDNTVFGITLETLADPVRGLGASPAELQWATGAYALVFATLMFTAGAVGDSFGHRNVLAVGLVIFGGASIWAACAGGADQLIAARAAIGVGAALIMPANFVILPWTFTDPGGQPQSPFPRHPPVSEWRQDRCWRDSCSATSGGARSFSSTSRSS
jgi:MFS family permease